MKERGEAGIAQERAVLPQKPGTAWVGGLRLAHPERCPLELKLRGLAPSEQMRMRDGYQVMR